VSKKIFIINTNIELRVWLELMPVRECVVIQYHMHSIDSYCISQNTIDYTPPIGSGKVQVS